MAAANLPEHLRTIDELLDHGDLQAAESRLSGVEEAPEVDVLRIKLALLDHSLPPPIAMQRLIQVMREHPDVGGGRELYQLASGLAYRHGQSSVSHSHPPPPVAPKDSEDDE
jgi:hypothetical protein